MKILEMEEVDEQDGIWEPFAKIVVEEGGDKSAFTAAENYCSQCFELHSKGETFHKRPWVLYNDFTKRVEMLYIKIMTSDCACALLCVCSEIEGNEKRLDMMDIIVSYLP